MTVLDKLASALDRADEVPNQLLAKELVDNENAEDIQELVDGLTDAKKAIRHDCIKVLYEIGYAKPALITPFADNFLALIQNKDNRLVWGGMTALGTIAALKAEEIGQQLDVVMQVTEGGSAITQDWGIRVLATVAVKNTEYEKRILPFLATFLQNCPAKDVPRHAESVLPMLHASNKTPIAAILEARKTELKDAGQKRIEKLLRQIAAI